MFSLRQSGRLVFVATAFLFFSFLSPFSLHDHPLAHFKQYHRLSVVDKCHQPKLSLSLSHLFPSLSLSLFLTLPSFVVNYTNHRRPPLTTQHFHHHTVVTPIAIAITIAPHPISTNLVLAYGETSKKKLVK